MKTALRLAALLAINLVVSEAVFVLLSYGSGVAYDINPRADLQMATMGIAMSYVPWACVGVVALWQVVGLRWSRFRGRAEWFLPGSIAGFLTAIAWIVIDLHHFV